MSDTWSADGDDPFGFASDAHADAASILTSALASAAAQAFTYPIYAVVLRLQAAQMEEHDDDEDASRRKPAKRELGGQAGGKEGGMMGRMMIDMVRTTSNAAARVTSAPSDVVGAVVGKRPRRPSGGQIHLSGSVADPMVHQGSRCAFRK